MTNTRTIISFTEAMEHLASYTNYERTSDYIPGGGGFGTRRIENLLAKLDRPHLAQPVVHIAGTKGKGSVAILTARLLQAIGLKVGLYTSPHLQHITERIAIDGEPLSEERFCEYFAMILPVLATLSDEERPTYFEILTALAFLAFARNHVDAVVLETGLGGRLDATNVQDLPVVASVITTVSLDHTAQLGATLEEIAAEKAGIVRPGVPVVIAPQQKRVDEVLRSIAGDRKSQIIKIGNDVTCQHTAVDSDPEAPQRLTLTTWHARHNDIPLPLLGNHQATNAAIALAAVETFLEQQKAGPVDTMSLRKAWRDLTIPGRIEIMDRAPWVIIDGAHNAASAWALADTLEQRFGKLERTMVFAAARDKKITAMLRILAPLMKSVILTTIDSPRSMVPSEMREILLELGFTGTVQVQPDNGKAFAAALADVDREGLVCVTGSLYLAGSIRNIYS